MKPPRSAEARSLATPLFRQRKIPSKKVYNRKKPALVKQERAFCWPPTNMLVALQLTCQSPLCGG